MIYKQQVYLLDKETTMERMMLKLPNGKNELIPNRHFAISLFRYFKIPYLCKKIKTWNTIQRGHS